MTYGELQDEVIDLRLKESQRSSVMQWINLRYQFVWGYADWPWKRVGPADLTLTAGDSTPTPPVDFNRPLRLYDHQGSELAWLSPDEFDKEYLYSELSGTRGRPQAFKWVHNQVFVAPVPDAAYTYELVYERKLSHLVSGAITLGPMDSALDEPIWDSAYHYVLVYGALADGLRLENDPTYPQIEEQFAVGLQSMLDHYLPTQSPAGNMQFGADTL